MPLIGDTIPNLINGVSQQAEAARLASQSSYQLNGISSVTDGNSKRYPTKHIAKLINGTLGSSFVHHYVRDANEQYVVIANGSTIRVFDRQTGTEKTVTHPDGWDYVTTTDPEADLRAVTIGDYTFLVNRTKTVAMASDVSPAKVNEVLLWVGYGLTGIAYNVTIDGTLNTTTSGTPNSETIAAALETLLNADFASPTWEITRLGSVIHIKRADGADFDISVSDGYGNNALRLIKDKVAQLGDLPTQGSDGFIAKIVGQANEQTDDYYVQFSVEDTSDLIAGGVWNECLGPGTVLGFDASTMPHVLVRNGDGTFTFKEADWDQRTAGDATSVPDPSFVGKTINDLVLYRDRLGVLSGNSEVFSQAGQYFNFFATTVTTLLDDMPIDLTAGTTQAATQAVSLYHAVPFDQQLVAFSDAGQFITKSDSLFTIKSAELSLVTAFQSLRDVRPAVVGRTVLFASKRGDFSSIYEYYIQPNTSTYDAADITGHVPRYIEGDVLKIVGLPSVNSAFVLADGDRTKIWTYRYYWVGDNKPQSSWSHWHIAGSPTVLGMDGWENSLYLVLQYSDGVYLERIDMGEGLSDTSLDHVVYLDRRLTEAQVTAAYDSDTDLTTFTLPYAVPNAAIGCLVVRPGTVPAGVNAGQVFYYTTLGGTSGFTLEGDHTDTTFYFGLQYEHRYRMPVPFVRTQSGNGSQLSFTGGRLQIRAMYVNFHDSGPFTVEVTPDKRATATYRYSGRRLGDGANVIGQVSLTSGLFRFGCACENTRLQVDLVNTSHLPSHWDSAGWEAYYVYHPQRI